MRAEAYDMDDEGNPNDFTKQDFIGAVDFQLSQVVNSLDQVITFPISHKKGNFSMIVQAEEKVNKPSETVQIQLQSQKSGQGYFYIFWKSISPG